MLERLARQAIPKSAVEQHIRRTRRAGAAPQVLVIHGPDKLNLRELKAILDAENVRYRVLQDEAPAAEMIRDKVLAALRQGMFALVLYTADDRVTPRSGKKYRQPRPNVFAEAFAQLAMHGPSSLCILRQKNANIPSDLQGIEYLEFRKSVADIAEPIRQVLVRAGVLREPAQA